MSAAPPPVGSCYIFSQNMVLILVFPDFDGKQNRSSTDVYPDDKNKLFTTGRILQ